MQKGQLIAASCNDKSVAGYSRLAVNIRNPDGSDHRLLLYWVDGANRTMWVEHYKVRREGDKVHKKIEYQGECRRELAP